ncbi:hypothetical protein [Actinomadura nitritigenes]|uniref:hypothetical protein n=1 Tax=Actinomadura nitritigenes TaxID=134602 RepID=UPI003D8C8798
MSEQAELNSSVPFLDVIKNRVRLRDATAIATLQSWLRQEVLADHIVIRNGDDHETEIMLAEEKVPSEALGWVPRWKVADLLVELSRAYQVDDDPYEHSLLGYDDVLLVLDDENLSLGEIQASGEAFIGGDGQPWYCVYSPADEEE